MATEGADLGPSASDRDLIPMPDRNRADYLTTRSDTDIKDRLESLTQLPPSDPPWRAPTLCAVISSCRRGGTSLRMRRSFLD